MLNSHYNTIALYCLWQYFSVLLPLILFSKLRQIYHTEENDRMKVKCRASQRETNSKKRNFNIVVSIWSLNWIAKYTERITQFIMFQQYVKKSTFLVKKSKHHISIILQLTHWLQGGFPYNFLTTQTNQKEGQISSSSRADDTVGFFNFIYRNILERNPSLYR